MAMIRSAERPPTGLRHGVRSPMPSVLGVRSQQTPQTMVDSRRHHGSENEYDDIKDDDSIDTYVSIISTRGSKVGTSPPVTSHTMRPRSSSVSVVSKIKQQIEMNSSTLSASNAGILNKLKNDIHSLERLQLEKQQEQQFPEKSSENDYTNRLRYLSSNSVRSNSTSRSTVKSPPTKDSRAMILMTPPSRAINSGNRIESDDTSVRSNSSFKSSDPGRLRDLRSISSSSSSSKHSLYDGARSNDSRGSASVPLSLTPSRDSSHGSTLRSNEADSRSMSSFRAAVVTIPTPPTRARSVDRAYRIPDPVDTSRKETSSWKKPPTNRPWNPQSIQIAAENNELLKQLQETVCSLKEESIKTTEEYENKMRDYSDIKSQLEKFKSNEVELAKTLQRVLTDVESQQSVTSQELSIVYKLRESETKLLEEKFNGALCDRDEAEQKLYNKMQEVESMWMDKVMELENELQTYESVHHEFNSLKSIMSEKMRDVDKENRRLHEENKSTKAEAEKAVALAKEETQAALENVKCLTQKMDEIDTKNSELDLSLAEANISKVNMELDLNNIKADLENQSRILATTEEKRLQQISQIEDLTKSNAQMKEEIHILNEKLQDRNEQIAERNQEMKVLQLKVDQAQSQSDAKENKLLALDAKLDFKLAKAGQEIEALQTQIQERDKLLMEMKQTTESSKMKIQIAEGEIECRDKKMNEYNSEVKHLRMTVQQSDKEVNVLKMKVQEKDKQLNDQNVTIENLQTMVEGLNCNVKRYEKKIPEYEAQLGRLKADLGEYKTKTSITEKEVLSLQSELVSVNKRRESSEKVASVAKEQESKLKGTIQGLRSELQMATQNLETTESKLATVRAEGDARKCQLKTALQSLDEMMAYITSMRDENDEVVTSLEGDLEKALLAKQELKKRIDYLERKEKDLTEEVKLRRNELETCRENALKEANTMKDEHAEKFAAMKSDVEMAIKNKKDAEKALKESINIMEQKQRDQKEAISIQENENKRLLEELETCRLDAIKEVGKMREEFNICLTELKEKSSSQELLLKQELQLLREQNESLACELEERKLQITADGKTSDEEVTNLKLKLHEGQEQYDLVNNELVEIKASYAALETNLQEALSESDTLRNLVNVLETKIDATQEDTSKEIKQMKNDADQWRKKVAACEDKLKESLTRHSKLATENNQLSEKLTRAEAVITKLSANLSESMEQANGFEEIAKKLEKSKKIEKVTRMEIAQLRSEIARKNSNEKHLEDHVASLEEQVNKLVADYESKLEKQSAKIRIRKSRP